MDRIKAAEVFVAITERGSMIAAADALDMSRAMVTRYLAQMEQWAGSRLLHRSTRSMSLTDAGEQVLARCRQLLDIAGAMHAASESDASEPHGLLRIACSPSLGQSALAAAVTAYLARHTRVRVDLQLSNQAANLVDERIDLAIRITSALEPNLIARRLGVCASVVCASPAYLAARGTPRRVEELSLHNCLAYSYFGKSLWHFTRGADTVSVPVSGNLTANDSLVLLSAAAQGAGVALQPRYSAVPLIARGELVELLPEFTPQEMTIYGLYTSRQHMTLALRTMLDELVDWFENNPGWRALGS